MARGRPKKQTVDYFPHYAGASDGKTLFILQSRFGNDGYAFWFKLLEILASSEGHFFDYRKSPDWQFLLAKTGISDSNKATEILRTLADLNAIDPELHEQNIAWSQNFVDNLVDLYKRRAVEIPQRPVISADIKALNANNKSISTSNNTESKLKETIVNEIKEKTPLLSPHVCPSVEAVINAYQDNVLQGATITEDMEQELKGACSRYSPSWVVGAIREAVLQNQPTWRYIMGVLKNWRRERR